MLAEAKLVQGDLLEILALWPDEATESRLKAKLALACLQLLVPLTWPLELDEEKTTVNHARHGPYLQLAQVAYKRALLHHEHAPLLRTVIRLGLPAMAVERRERSNRDEGVIKLVLYLFRNVAMIAQPQMLPSQGDENEIGRAATIEAFARQDVFSLLLTIGSGASDDFQHQDVILLEILFHLLKGIDAKKLFWEDKELQRAEADELRTLMLKEKAMLSGYKKHAPTRHHRFGTMIWVKRDDMKVSTVSGQQSIADENATLQQMDATKKWNKPKYRAKAAQESNEYADITMRVDLTESARKKLRSFVEDFLDSSFNPLFSSLRRAIEREADRVGDIHKRQYFYLIHWFLHAENARRDQALEESSTRANVSTQTTAVDNSFAYIAAVLDQETFVLLNRSMQRAFDEKSWQDLQATLLCFTQILLTVQSMAESKDDEDQEIAENIQNRIFYEESTHDRLVQILRGYTNQGFTYLDAVTECVHVFVRMLERYSKQNADLQIRSKRRARRKKQIESGGNAGDDDAEQADEDEREAHVTVSERKFDFARFSAKFLSQGCVDTFVSLTRFYADLSPAQLKRCHRYFYRLAFKHDLSLFLFRVDILQLLHRMIKGPNGLSPDIEGFKDWEQLVQQVFRRCIKWMTKQTEGDGWLEMCVVEMLFSKIPGTVFYLQNGYDRVVEKRGPRVPAELEFKAAVAEKQKIPVIVSVLLEQAKGDAIEWVKKELQRTCEERGNWENERKSWADGFGEDGAANADESKAPVICWTPDNEERKMAMFSDKHLRLLLTTLGIERLGPPEDVDASWIVNSDLKAENLRDALEAVRNAEYDPPSFEEGQTAADMVRNKSSGNTRQNTVNASATFDESNSEGAVSDIDKALFPPNLREHHSKNPDERSSKRRRLIRRGRKELTEAEVEERAEARRRREKERNVKIKSQLYVTAEDDETDEERDAEFFRLEEDRRRKMAGFIRTTLRREGKGKKRKGEREEKEMGDAKKRKRFVGESEDEGGGSDIQAFGGLPLESDDSSGVSDVEMGDEEPSPLVRRRRSSVSSSNSAEGESDADHERISDVGEDGAGKDGAEEETPSTSPTTTAPEPLTEVSANVITSPLHAAPTKGGDDDSEHEHDLPITKPSVRRRNVRAGFIIDDSDSE